MYITDAELFSRPNSDEPNPTLAGRSENTGDSLSMKIHATLHPICTSGGGAPHEGKSRLKAGADGWHVITNRD